MMKMKSSRGTTATATSTKCEELAATRDSLVLLCCTAAPQEPRVLEVLLATRTRPTKKPRNNNQAQYTANSERTRKQKGFVVRAFSQSLARPRSLAQPRECRPERSSYRCCAPITSSSLISVARRTPMCASRSASRSARHRPSGYAPLSRRQRGSSAKHRPTLNDTERH